MELWRRLTAAFVLTAPAIVVIYDVIVYLVAGPKATITDVVQGWSREYTELPYVVGGLMVWLWLHLFFEIIIKGR